MSTNGYTPTQVRILNVLKDGQPHLRDELLLCIQDNQATIHQLRQHIHLLRARLPPDEAIVCELFSAKTCYRHVKLLIPCPPQERPKQNIPGTGRKHIQKAPDTLAPSPGIKG